MTPRVWLSVAILLALAGCRDAAAPLNQDNVMPPQFSAAPSDTTRCILQQSPTAPPLETYRVSFWAYKGAASTVTVSYQTTPSHWVGQPFLRFDIPKNGLVAGAEGAPLKRGDSVYVTVTIDSVSFSMHFQPSGVLFSKTFPANLTLWYGNANLDLNRNGVVDSWDWKQLQQLAIWYHAPTMHSWSELSSSNDTSQLLVSAALYHFSEYAVSW